MILRAFPAFLVVALLGCAGGLRDADTFRDDTGKQFDEKVAAMRTCYDGLQKTTPGIRGTVTVSFVWEHETGALRDLEVDPAASNAPAAVRECVIQSLTGLVLTPKDDADGHGRWRFDFMPPAPRS